MKLPTPPQPEPKRQREMDIFELRGVREQDIHAWKVGTVSLAEMEAAHLVKHPSFGEQPRPFGFMHDKWSDFNKLHSEEDEIWEFNGFPYSNGINAAREGYALIRDGKVIEILVTAFE